MLYNNNTKTNNRLESRLQLLSNNNNNNINIQSLCLYRIIVISQITNTFSTSSQLIIAHYQHLFKRLIDQHNFTTTGILLGLPTYFLHLIEGPRQVILTYLRDLHLSSFSSSNLSIHNSVIDLDDNNNDVHQQYFIDSRIISIQDDITRIYPYWVSRCVDSNRPFSPSTTNNNTNTNLTNASNTIHNNNNNNNTNTLLDPLTIAAMEMISDQNQPTTTTTAAAAAAPTTINTITTTSSLSDTSSSPLLSDTNHNNQVLKHDISSDDGNKIIDEIDNTILQLATNLSHTLLLLGKRLITMNKSDIKPYLDSYLYKIMNNISTTTTTTNPNDIFIPSLSYLNSLINNDTLCTPLQWYNIMNPKSLLSEYTTALYDNQIWPVPRYSYLNTIQALSHNNISTTGFSTTNNYNKGPNDTSLSTKTNFVHDVGNELSV